MNLNHPPNCLTFNILRAGRNLARGFENAVKDLGLTASQFTELGLLAGHGSMTVGQMAEQMGTERTTMTRNLDVMTRKGWIEPVATEDQRQRAYVLTGAGKVLLDAAMPAWSAYQARIVGLIGRDTAETLLAIVGKL